MTISHFGRLLHFLKVFVAPEEFRLLVRKFLKDGHSVNFRAFVSALELVTKYKEQTELAQLGAVRVCIEIEHTSMY